MTLGGGIMRKLVVILAVATIHLGSCATSPNAYYASQPRCDASQPDPAVAESCLAIPQVRGYLEQAQKQVYDAWQLPRGVAENQSVRLTFRLRLDGSIQCLSLSADPSEDLGQSVVSALQHATPFAPLPSEAACLGELPVIATFSNLPAKQ